MDRIGKHQAKVVFPRTLHRKKTREGEFFEVRSLMAVAQVCISSRVKMKMVNVEATAYPKVFFKEFQLQIPAQNPRK